MSGLARRRQREPAEVDASVDLPESEVGKILLAVQPYKHLVAQAAPFSSKPRLAFLMSLAT
jgi:hypothetical protein